jgi:prepilin-type N-terminal cleavage/methylation domain-containing protein
MKATKPNAFSLIELLVVMAVIAVLAGLLLPSLSTAESRSEGVQCGNNLRQLGLAWTLYAADNEGHVAQNQSSPNESLPHNWAGGWLNKMASNSDNTNSSLLKNGQFGPYMDSLESFKCPGDTLTVKIDGKHRDRPRSVAMNFYVGFKAIGRAGEWQEVMKTSDMKSLSPNKTFTMIVQREDGINDTWYRVDALRGLVENPAFYHKGADNLVFGDGHVELHKWVDPRTTPELNRKLSSWHVGPNVGEGWANDNMDINWLRARASTQLPVKPLALAENSNNSSLSLQP